MYKYLVIIFFPFLGMAQENNSQVLFQDLIGFWKLEEAGFWDNDQKEIKNFNDCRLSRNYEFLENGTFIYTYYEGDNDACYVSKPEIYNWRVEGERLQIIYNDEIVAQKKIEKISENQIVFTDIKNRYIKEDNDSLIEKVLNAVHYEQLKKQNQRIKFENAKSL